MLEMVYDTTIRDSVGEGWNGYAALGTLYRSELC